MQQSAQENPTFEQNLNGSFYGVLRWEQLDQLWQVVTSKAADGWYLYTVSEAPPQTPAAADEVVRFITALTAQLREKHEESYCGLVYVDDKDDPALIKIYDPAKFRGSCSCGPAALPGWILSLQRPVDLNDSEKNSEKSKGHWWRKLFGTGETA